MNDFLKYCQDNWLNLVVIGLTILSLLVVLFRKKAVLKLSDDMFEEVLCLLPGWINEAELSGDSGDKKLDYVIRKAIEHLREIGTYQSTNLGLFVDFIKVCVERILSTPTKKG